MDVVPKSVAALAGVRRDDIIVALADRLVTSIDDLHRLLMTIPAGSDLEITVVRGEALRTLTITAESR
jgi:S1-C subfamily serine protease